MELLRLDIDHLLDDSRLEILIALKTNGQPATQSTSNILHEIANLLALQDIKEEEEEEPLTCAKCKRHFSPGEMGLMHKDSKDITCFKCEDFKP